MNYDIRKLNEVKYFKHNHMIILAYMCHWIASKKPPVHKEFDGRLYYWFSLQKIAEDLSLSYQQVQLALFRLENKDKKIDYVTEPLVYQKMDYKSNRMFLSVDLPNLKNLIECKKECNVKIDFNTLQKRIGGPNIYTKRIGKMGQVALFDIEEVKYCKEADAIARLILRKYPQYFSHRVPDNSAPTKTYINICKCITDIYNGAFVKSRMYPLSDGFLNNNQFNIDGWRDKIKNVRGNWLEVRRLILGALKNFVLMHNEDRMPYSKNYLQSNLSLWFYDSVSIPGEPQSQFIISLFEPEFTKKHNSELKADKIFDTLSDKAKKGGNDLFELNTSMPSGIFWECIKNMVEWGKNAFEVEENIQYWITSASELPEKFAKYCIENKITVSIPTVDIEKAVDCNGPWTWFVKDACLKHGLNNHLAECVTIEDLVDCYSSSKKITFDDMDEVVF